MKISDIVSNPKLQINDTKQSIVVWGLFSIILVSILMVVYILDKSAYICFATEDKLGEYLTAVFYAISAIILIIAVWKKSDRMFNYMEGDTVFCYTSIFAPTELTKKCFHHWQRYLPDKSEWITTDRLGYEISGGRHGGYRGYTFKRHVIPGKWRVDVETEEKMLLGRINFKVRIAEKKDRTFKTIMK